MKKSEKDFLSDYPVFLVLREWQAVMNAILKTDVSFGRFKASEIMEIRRLWKKRKGKIEYVDLLYLVYVDGRYGYGRRFSKFSEFESAHVEARVKMKEDIEIEVIKRFIYNQVPEAHAAKMAYRNKKMLGEAA